jgi:hypothetical protein
MNERIKELSAIAKNLTTDDAIHLSRIHNRTLSLDELGEIFEQKFAELIVRECMMLCGAVSGAAQVTRPNDAFGDGAEKCKALINQHFGVES